MADPRLTSYVKQLFLDLGIAEMAEENEAGMYPIDFTNNLIVLVGSLPTGFYFTAKLGPAPAPQNCETFFSTAMQANLFGQGTGGTVIGLDNEGKTMMLSLALTYQISYPQFKEYLENFVNYADLWQKKTSDASV